MSKKFLKYVILVLVLILSGCSFGGAEDAAPTPTDQVVLPSVEPTHTPAPPPTAVPDVAVLLSDSNSDPAKVAEVETALTAFVESSGFQLTRLPALDAAAAPAGLRLVVAVAPAPAVAELATVMPQVQFVAVGYADLPLAANLTVVSGNKAEPAMAFTAGYIAAVQSEEYRVGVISTNDASGQLYSRAFMNGAIYFCGICAPVFPPYEIYPIVVELPPGASPTELEAAAEVMFSRGVTVVHVIPSLQTDAIHQYIAQRGVFLVGTGAPPAGLEGNWSASVVAVPQMGLDEILQAVMDRGALGQIGATLKIDYAVASEARVRHFEEIIQHLESGFIDPVGAVE